jgi:serine protease Do
VKRHKLWVLALVFTLLGLAMGLVLSSSLNLPQDGYSQEAASLQAVLKEGNFLQLYGQAMAQVVEAVKASVVNISTTRRVRLRGVPSPFFDDPFFRRFFGEEFRWMVPPRERRTMSLGSGVIVSPDGYILTNNHVIRGAEQIKVTLADKREFEGRVIGTDPKTDLAVIKIQAQGLPSIRWGDSDALRVGEPVIAIGSPYGLTQTVTAGIVSATGRANVGIADYEDFIQTDAAINPGNSGGALVNARGELVGINTAIFSTTGGYQGIGFAIPSNMAKVVMESLIREGRVVRGWLGIWIQPLTEELAQEFGLQERQGALVADVVEGSPAEKAGLRRGDFITHYNGKPVEGPTELRNMVASTRPGSTVKLKLIRQGKELLLKVRIAELPADEQEAALETENVLRGVHVQELTPSLRQHMGLPRRVQGVVVTMVEEQSPAFGLLRRDDVIMEVNRERVRTLGQYRKALSKVGKRVLLLIYRQGAVFYLTISE